MTISNTRKSLDAWMKKKHAWQNSRAPDAGIILREGGTLTEAGAMWLEKNPGYLIRLDCKINLQTIADSKNGNGLQGVDLSGTSLKAIKLPKANLQGAVFAGSNLAEADLSEAKLQGSVLKWSNLTHTNLQRALLKTADLRGVRNLHKASLEAADLEGAQLDPKDSKKAFGKGAILSAAPVSSKSHQSRAQFEPKNTLLISQGGGSPGVMKTPFLSTGTTWGGHNGAHAPAPRPQAAARSSGSHAARSRRANDKRVTS